MPTLEQCRAIATEQARMKEWNVSTKWLIKKLDEEYKELINAIHHKKPRDIVEEISDFIIVAVQIKHNESTNYSLDYAFERKITDNYKNKKKTFDEKTQEIVMK